MDPRLFFQNRHEQIHTLKISSHRCSSGNPKIALAYQRLDLHQNRSCSFHGTGHHRSGSVLRTAVQKKFRRIFDLRKTGLLHLKYPDFVGGTKTVLHAPKDPVRSMAVALKIEYRVYHVLQNPWAGNISLFGHMADNKNRHAHSFCDLHENIGGLSHL